MSEEHKPLDLIKKSTGYFESKGIANARLDAELLLADILGCKRLELYTGFEQPMAEANVNKYREYVKKRAEREPVSHILGKREFMGIEFKITGDVLTPRQETEILVEEAVRLLKENKIIDATNTVLDIGTGSGCIAVSIAANCPKVSVVASDISAQALLVARDNAQDAGVWERVDMREGDLLGACWETESFDLVVSNPPYINEGDENLSPEVKDYDPSLALFGGTDGLDYYRNIIAEVEKFINPGGSLLFEVGAGQAEAVGKMIKEFTLLEDVRFINDHCGIERVVAAIKPAL